AGFRCCWVSPEMHHSAHGQYRRTPSGLLAAGTRTWPIALAGRGRPKRTLGLGSSAASEAADKSRASRGRTRWRNRPVMGPSSRGWSGEREDARPVDPAATLLTARESPDTREKVG